MCRATVVCTELVNLPPPLGLRGGASRPLPFQHPWRPRWPPNCPPIPPLINDEFVQSKTAQWRNIINPAHAGDARPCALAAPDELAAAVAAAKAAFAAWRKTPIWYGGDTQQLAPPFITEKSEIDRLVSALGDALEETAK